MIYYIVYTGLNFTWIGQEAILTKPDLIDYQILINTFLIRNCGISPWMKTPHTLRRPLPGIEPTTLVAYLPRSVRPDLLSLNYLFFVFILQSGYD